MLTTRPVRERADRCPGLTRPWPAEDGALVRIRLVGGLVSRTQLGELVRLAGAYGDGDLHLTSRANVQVRGISYDGALPTGLVEAVAAAGLLPSPAHELVRNVLVSPLTGRLGGLADVRPVASELDRLLLADPDCAHLPGRFLFGLDDGRGDVIGHESDLAVQAVDGSSVQLRAGSVWGPVVPLTEAAGSLHALARDFLAGRGDGPSAAWHVDELPDALVLHEEHLAPTDPGANRAEPGLGRLRQDDGRLAEHVGVPDGTLTPTLAEHVLAHAADDVIVTPWRSVLLVDLEER